VNPGIRMRRAEAMVAAVAVVLIGGTVGFHATLSETWLQSFYRSVVTASLTGLDSVPNTNAARVITIVMVLCGITIFGYIAAVIVEVIAGDVVTGALAERRRRRTIESLREHFIICGYGRVGRRVAEEFRAAGVRYVVLDFSQDAIEYARDHDDLFVQGKGVEDEDLERAGLARAAGLVAASDSDADNLYITLSARSSCPGLTIVARASGVSRVMFSWESSASNSGSRGRPKRMRKSARLAASTAGMSRCRRSVASRSVMPSTLAASPPTIASRVWRWRSACCSTGKALIARQTARVMSSSPSSGPTGGSREGSGSMKGAGSAAAALVSVGRAV